MTSRERVEKVLAHKEPDRVPIDLWGSASRIHTDLYKRIAEHLQFPTLGERIRKGSTTEYVDWKLSDVLHSDFRHIHVSKNVSFVPYVDAQGNTIDEWGIGRKNIGGFNAITKHPLQGLSLDEIKRSFRLPNAKDPGRFEGVFEQARAWFTSTPYAISTTTAVSGLFMELGQYLRGDTDFLMDLYINKEVAHYIIGRLEEFFTELYLEYITPIADYICWIEFTEDFGMQDRPFFPPEIFREFFLEPHRRLFSTLKKAAPKAKIFFHSCGSVYSLIPEFIEMGIDILNSLQPSAAGMDSFILKKEFGSELVFHGGLDIQDALLGSREKAIEEAKRRIDAFGPGGGYVFAPSNHFLDDIPIENILAVYETALTYGTYE